MRISIKPVGSLTCVLLVLFFLVIGVFPERAHAADAREIDVSVNVALEQFRNEVKGAGEFLGGAKGYLVFPKVEFG